MALVPYFTDVNFLYGVNQNKLIIPNFDAINSQIIYVLSVTPGERPFEPTFGSQVPSLLFDPINDKTAYMLEGAMYESIERWIERVSVNKAESRVTAKPDAGAYETYLVYTVSLEKENRYLQMKMNQRK